MTIQDDLGIVKASELMQTGQYIPKFLILGRSGGGKTHALLTLPKEWQVLVLDFFGNKETLEGAPNIDVLSYSDYDPRDPVAYTEIDADRRKLINTLEKGQFPYKVLVIDTITGMIRFTENHILTIFPDGKGIGGAPAQHHYRGLSHMTGQLITGFLGFPIITILNAHAQEVTSEGGGVIGYEPIMSGKVWRNTIGTYVGEVYRAFGQESDQLNERGEPVTQYLWQTQPDHMWKDLKSVMNRGGTIWGKYVEPNYEKLFRRRGIIKEGGNE